MREKLCVSTTGECASRGLGKSIMLETTECIHYPDLYN